LLAALAAAASGCKRPRSLLHVDPDPAIDTTYDAPNGMLRLHYPKSFAARVGRNNVVSVSRVVGMGEDESVSVVAVDRPISNDVREFARVVLDRGQEAEAKLTTNFHETARFDAKCFGENDGIEAIAAFESKTLGVEYVQGSCTFLRDGHGYYFSWALPAHLSNEHGPLLRKIMRSTELLSPASPRAGAP
jgi:hypothetical protein